MRGSAPAEGVQTYRRVLEARCGRLLEPRPQPDTASRSFSLGGAPDLRTGGLQVDSGVAQLLKVASAGPKPERFVSGFRQLQATVTPPKFVLAVKVC